MFLDSRGTKCLGVTTHRDDQLIISQVEACPLPSIRFLPLASLKLSLSSMPLVYQGLRGRSVLHGLFNCDLFALEIDSIGPALEEADICSLGTNRLEGSAELEGANRRGCQQGGEGKVGPW